MWGLPWVRSVVPDPRRPSVPTCKAVDWLAERCLEQRSALALYLHESSTPCQIAVALDLRPDVVLAILRSGVAELLATVPDPAPAPASRRAIGCAATPQADECSAAHASQ